MHLALVCGGNMLIFSFKHCCCASAEHAHNTRTLLVCSFSDAGVTEAIARVDKQTRTRFTCT